MNKRKPIIKSVCAVLSLTVCFSLMAGFTTASKAAASQTAKVWETVLKAKTPYPANLAGFWDKTNGITVGASGEIHYTSDGGKTWPQGKNNSMCRYGMDMLSKSVTICCGNGSTVKKTTDGGKTWTALANTDLIGKFACFINEKKGFIGSGFELETTNDGGKTWSPVKTPDEIGEISGMYFNSAVKGYLLDSQGNLFITTNGGKSWKSKKIALGGDILSVFAPTAAVSFKDDKHGIVVCALSTGKIAAFKTENGGSTWKAETFPSDVKFGTIFMHHDRKTFTILDPNGAITVLKYKN